MIQNLQNFLQEFVTNPDSGDNCFIFQLPFHNNNIGVRGQKKQKCPTPEYYGWPKNLKFSVNELYEMQHFIDYKKFKTLICNKTGKNQLPNLVTTNLKLTFSQFMAL